jgi:hypothetical protein
MFLYPLLADYEVHGSCRIKTRYFFFTVIFNLSYCFARSPMPCQDIDKSKVIPIEKVKDMIQKDGVFNVIKKNWSNEVKILPSSCLNDKGQIKILGQHMSILGKKCWLGDQLISFKIEANKVFFRAPSVVRKSVTLEQYNREFMKKTLEEIVKNPIASNFFKLSNLCQVEFNNTPKELNMWLKLRDKSKNWCFLESNVDGSDLKVIKRLYAKDSQCSLNQ